MLNLNSTEYRHSVFPFFFCFISVYYKTCQNTLEKFKKSYCEFNIFEASTRTVLGRLDTDCASPDKRRILPGVCIKTFSVLAGTVSRDFDSRQKLPLIKDEVYICKKLNTS